MASPPESSLLNVPDVRSIRRAPALAPADSLICLISAWETVLSTVTLRVLVAGSTFQAVPAMSAPSTASLAAVSWLALNVPVVLAWALGTARAATATRPAAIATALLRLAMPLRGWCA